MQITKTIFSDTNNKAANSTFNSTNNTKNNENTDVTKVDKPRLFHKSDEDAVLLTLSEEAKDVVTTSNSQDDKKSNNKNYVPENMIDQYSKMLEEQRESAKQAAKATEDMAKILEIARRIASGAKVPKTDEQKLMEYNFELYLSAKEAAMLNQEKEKKEYDRLFKDEENNNEGIITRENGELKVDVSQLNLANSKMEMIKANVIL